MSGPGTVVAELGGTGGQQAVRDGKDCLAFAKSQSPKLRFDLYVRGGANPTKLSKPLLKAITNGEITRKYIP